VSNAPNANINGTSTKIVIASVKISDFELLPMRLGRRAANACRAASWRWQSRTTRQSLKEAMQDQTDRTMINAA
jgi:hypothetical protein